MLLSSLDQSHQVNSAIWWKSKRAVRMCDGIAHLAPLRVSIKLRHSITREVWQTSIFLFVSHCEKYMDGAKLLWYMLCMKFGRNWVQIEQEIRGGPKMGGGGPRVDDSIHLCRNWWIDKWVILIMTPILVRHTKYWIQWSIWYID